MAKNISTRPSKAAKEEALLGTHHGYTISLRDAEPVSYRQKSVGQQYVVVGPKNEELIRHLKNAGARWDSFDKVWTIAKSKASKLIKIVEQLPEILAGQAQLTNSAIDAVQDLLRPLAGFKSNDQRWHKKIAVELSSNGTGLTIYVEAGPRTAEKFRAIGCKQDKDEYGHKKFWLPLSKHEALRELIEELPGLWEAWIAEGQQKIASVVGTYGPYTVAQHGFGLTVKGPKMDRLIAAMRELGGQWMHHWFSPAWLVDGSKATRLLSVMQQVEGWYAEEVARQQKAEEEAEVVRQAKIAKEEAEDQRVGRIYFDERNVDRGDRLPQEIYRDGRYYRLEKTIYAGPEYGSDGDWMLSGSYLPLSAEEQEQRQAAEQAKRKHWQTVESARRELSALAGELAQEQITRWPATIETLYSSQGRGGNSGTPFVTLAIITMPTADAPGTIAVSYHASDYDVDKVGSVTIEQVERIRELARIIR